MSVVVVDVGGLDVWAEYAVGSRGPHFEWWCGENLVLGQSQWSGRALVLESWQARIMREALAVDVDGTPYWSTVALVVPRKNAKTTMLAALAVYSLDDGGGEPEILLAAGSDKQAGRLFDACLGFYRRSPVLAAGVHRRAYVGQIAHVSNGGLIQRLSSEGDTQHGANPSLVILDELHAWRQPKHVRSWGALTTADGARNDTQVFTITTEGERRGWEESILGQLVSENEAAGDVERVPGLTVSRDHASRTIVYRYHAVSASAANPVALRAARGAVKGGSGDQAVVDGLERALVESVLPANPASWITGDYLLEQAVSARVLPAQFMQLHANVAADVAESWIARDVWDRLVGEVVVPEGGEVAVAVDCAITHDSTAVAWAAKLEDGRVCVRCHTWGARAGVNVHEMVAGGRIRNDPVKAFIRRLAQRYRVCEVAYDPRFFEDAAMELSDEGFVVAPLVQSATPMRDAEQQFYDAVSEGLVVHDGDAVLAGHVAAATAERTDRGWRVRKLKQSEVIDALIAVVMAHYRARRFEGGGGAESYEFSAEELAAERALWEADPA